MRVKFFFVGLKKGREGEIFNDYLLKVVRNI